MLLALSLTIFTFFDAVKLSRKLANGDSGRRFLPWLSEIRKSDMAPDKGDVTILSVSSELLCIGATLLMLEKNGKKVPMTLAVKDYEDM